MLPEADMKGLVDLRREVESEQRPVKKHETKVEMHPLTEGGDRKSVWKRSRGDMNDRVLCYSQAHFRLGPAVRSCRERLPGRRHLH